MYHLRMTRGRSYNGVVTATRKRPDVYVEDAKVAMQLEASGFFTLLKDNAGGSKNTAAAESHLAKSQLEEMDLKDLKALAVDMGIKVAGNKKADYVNAIAAEPVTPGPETDEDGSETMIDLQQA